MNFQGNFRTIGTVDIAPILQLVEQFTQEDWERQSVRQKRYEVHKDTQFIGIVYDEDFRHQNGTRWPVLQLLGPVLQPVFKIIAEYYETAPETLLKFGGPVQGYFIRVTLAKLRAGGKISEHRDMNFSLAHSHRVHVPITTNADVTFKIGYETRHLPAGSVTEINNRRDHSVANEGSEDRVHLILDWVFPWEPCCCSETHHPGEPCTPDNCLLTDRLKVPCTCHPEDRALDAAASA